MSHYKVFNDLWLLYQISLVNLSTFKLLRKTFVKFYHKTLASFDSENKDSYYNLLYEHYGSRDLNYLVDNNHLNGIRWLYENPLRLKELENVDINKLNDLIYLASKKGYLEVVKYLSNLPGVDASVDNNCAIREASYNGHLEVVKYLAGLPGVDASADDNYAIRWASEKGHLEVVKFLANPLNAPALKGVDASTKDNYAIRWASLNGHLEVVQFLASLPGVDASADDNYAISCASRNGHKDVVAYLLTLPGVSRMRPSSGKSIY